MRRRVQQALKCKLLTSKIWLPILAKPTAESIPHVFTFNATGQVKLRGETRAVWQSVYQKCTYGENKRTSKRDENQRQRPAVSKQTMDRIAFHLCQGWNPYNFCFYVLYMTLSQSVYDIVGSRLYLNEGWFILQMRLSVSQQ